MKKPKRINSKRPSLWMSKANVAKIYLPSGTVFFFSELRGEWCKSAFSFEGGKNSISKIDLLKIKHTFLGYL